MRDSRGGEFDDFVRTRSVTLLRVAYLLTGDRHAAEDLPEEHAAILRHWHKQYGAELLAMTNDTVDIAVTRPPSTRAEALRAAWEFEMYNEGGYDEYGENITDTAASLLGADVLLAWWD